MSDGAPLAREAFSVDSTVGERVLFPASAAERHGIEDLRLVHFAADDGSIAYRRYIHRIRRGDGGVPTC